MKVDIYTRVSTAEQAKSGYSLPEQRELLKKYCNLNSWDVNAIHEDAGYSGSKYENRPGLQSLLDDVRFNRIEAVVVWKLDRLSRSQKDTLMIIEDYLLPNNVQIVSYTERLDTSTPGNAYDRYAIRICTVRKVRDHRTNADGTTQESQGRKLAWPICCRSPRIYLCSWGARSKGRPSYC